VVYFQMLSLGISTDVILWPTQAVTEMRTGIFCVGKGGWCLGLMILVS
jgi:hypothetical protein